MSLAETVLCTWARRWFLSYILLAVIIQIAMNYVGVEHSTISVIAMITLQVVIVKSINYKWGASCLSAEKEKLQKLVNLREAQIQMRS